LALTERAKDTLVPADGSGFTKPSVFHIGDVVDPLLFHKGHDLSFHLTMPKTGRVALAQTVFHNQESLVLIRSVKRGLVLHFLFFKDDIRDFDAIAKGDGVKLPAEQLELGMSPIEKMSWEDFEPERYADEYASVRLP
jgi:hypothetical protein